MSVAFRIKERVGFNPTAAEETLLLDAYLMVRESIQQYPIIQMFEDLFLQQGKAFEERVCVSINLALKTAELPAIHRFYPKPSLWDEYTRLDNEERVAIRRTILEKLGNPRERARIVRLARIDYDAMANLYLEVPSDYRQMFDDAVERIKNDQLSPPKPLLWTPPPQRLIELSSEQPAHSPLIPPDLRGPMMRLAAMGKPAGEVIEAERPQPAITPPAPRPPAPVYAPRPRQPVIPVPVAPPAPPVAAPPPAPAPAPTPQPVARAAPPKPSDDAPRPNMAEPVDQVAAAAQALHDHRNEMRKAKETMEEAQRRYTALAFGSASLERALRDAMENL